MSMTQLAIINQGPDRYEFNTNFDGVRYFLTFQYNKRNDTWYLDIKNADQIPILLGLPALTNSQNLAHRFVIDDFLPVGEIMIADINGDGIDPSYENFGDTVSSFYLSVLS